MTTRRAQRTPGHMGTVLREEKFMQMYGEFQDWRMDSFIRQMEAEKRKGRVLPFIRGLRLSAHLIYIARDILHGSDLTASWGHLLDKNEEFCSCECDVIIHKTGHVREWDGERREPVMNFKFIKQENAIAVISCKSHLTLSNIDKEYCKLMRPFVKNVWLFAECCSPDHLEKIVKKAKKHGYKKTWVLYTWKKQESVDAQKKGWLDFVTQVERLRV